jgi:hypothetical protein
MALLVADGAGTDGAEVIAAERLSVSFAITNRRSFPCDGVRSEGSHVGELPVTGGR